METGTHSRTPKHDSVALMQPWQLSPWKPGGNDAGADRAGHALMQPRQLARWTLVDLLVGEDAPPVPLMQPRQ